MTASVTFCPKLKKKGSGWSLTVIFMNKTYLILIYGYWINTVFDNTYVNSQKIVINKCGGFTCRAKSSLEPHKETDVAQGPAVRKPRVCLATTVKPVLPQGWHCTTLFFPLPPSLWQCNVWSTTASRHEVKAGEHLPAHPVPRGVSVDCPEKWMKKRKIKDKKDFKI